MKVTHQAITTCGKRIKGEHAEKEGTHYIIVFHGGVSVGSAWEVQPETVEEVN